MTWNENSYGPSAELQLETLLMKEHNRLCSKPLYRNTALKSCARWRAKDMLVRDYFSHTIKGTTNKVFAYFSRYNIPWTAAGEIMAWNTNTDTEAALAAYRQFMASHDHRVLLQSCRYYRLGAGAYKQNGKRMFVVLFTRY